MDAVREPSTDQPTPENIQRLGSGFRASKALFTAVELGLFTELADGPLGASTLAARLEIQARPAADFFDALVALGMLDRDEHGYANTPESDLFLDRAKPTYIGGMAEMQSRAGYRMWGSLTDALRSGKPQSAAGGNFELLYQDPVRMRRFLSAMTGGSLASARVMSRAFPWADYTSVIDIGTAQGCLPVQVALAHDHLVGGGFDLPPDGVYFDEYVASFGLNDRLRFFGGNYMTDELPRADVLVMGNILCDLDLAGKKSLIEKAHAALPDNGALIVYESLIDDDRRANSAALLTSLAMLLQKEGAFGFTGAECRSWMGEAGFTSTSVEHLEGPRAMVIARK